MVHVMKIIVTESHGKFVIVAREGPHRLFTCGFRSRGDYERFLEALQLEGGHDETPFRPKTINVYEHPPGGFGLTYYVEGARVFDAVGFSDMNEADACACRLLGQTNRTNPLLAHDSKSKGETSS